MEILNHISHILHYAVSFGIIISIIVFIHEFGHFYVARRCGVKVDEFSIGFGPEIYGWNDKHGTRWKISILPLGGFVKMHGDASEASTPDSKSLNEMSEEERKISFHYKKLWQKTLIVLAGPVANFILSVFIFAVIFMIWGKLQLDAPIVNNVVKGGAAEQIGLRTDDVITTLDGQTVKNFSDIPEIIKNSSHDEMVITYERGGQSFAAKITPVAEEEKDKQNKKTTVRRIGIEAFPIAINDQTPRLGPVAAVKEAVGQVYNQCSTTLKAIWQMIAGTRSSKQIGGPVMIMEYSGKSTTKISDALVCEISHDGKDCGKLAREGILISLIFMTIVSTGLGLVNLFPIPMLDGGHVLFYLIEAIMKRPIPEKAQEWAFKLGLAFIAWRLLYATYNDLTRMLT